MLAYRAWLAYTQYSQCSQNSHPPYKKVTLKKEKP